MSDNMKKYGSAPIFMNSEAKEAWNSSPDDVKKHILENLSNSMKKMETRLAVDILSVIIEELIERIQKLEENFDKSLS